MSTREMHIRSQQLGARPAGVSMDMKTSWAAQDYDYNSFANLENMARFQQKQLQEKEQKLLQLYDQQQQRAYQVVQRGSAGSNSSNHGGPTATVRGATSTHHTATSTSQGGKVRQMFDERRQTTVKGIDRSYPLEPLENKLRKQTTANANGPAAQRNGNLTVSRQSVSVKRMARADVNSNVNGGKPVVSYHEEVTRESFGPPLRHRHDDEDEFLGAENRGVATFANGYHRYGIVDDEEESLDQETVEKNRMMAKIHLMGYDDTLKHRVRNDLESEEFPEHLAADVPDKLPKRSLTKKLSQATARLERFKNANAKRSNMPKQSTATSTAMKKRSEQTMPARSNPRRSEIAGTSSPISAGSRSSATSRNSERVAQRSFESARNPSPTTKTRATDRRYVADEMGERRGSDTATSSEHDNPRSSSGKIGRAETASRIYFGSNDYKSLTPDGRIFVRHGASSPFFLKEPEKSATAVSFDRRSTGSKSASSDERQMRTRRSASPEFFCREGERSATTMRIDRRSPSFGSALFDWQKLMKRSASPRFFRREGEKSATTVSIDRESPSFRSTSSDRQTFAKRSTSPRFFRKEDERSTATVSIDRKIDDESKSSERSSEMYGKQSTSPQYFDTEFESSRSSLFRREALTKRSQSPRFYLSESEQSRRSLESKSPIWNGETSSRRNTSPRYFGRESKERSGTIASTDSKSARSKSSAWSKETQTKRIASPRYFDKNTWTETRRSASLDRETPSPSKSYDGEIFKKRDASPQFFCKESERSATTMSIDRATSESRSPSYPDRQIVTKRSATPRFFRKESERSTTTVIDRKADEFASPSYSRKVPKTRSEKSRPRFPNGEPEGFATAVGVGQEYGGSKSSKVMRDKRASSPQFFCEESERSATTRLIEPRSSATDSAKGILKQRDVSDASRVRSSPSINKKVRSAQKGNAPSPSVVKKELKEDLEEKRIRDVATETRRSSKLSEASATSTSSLVSLKYGLEFDNIFQSAGLVRKFMKTQNGDSQRGVRPRSSAKRNDSRSVQTARSGPSRNRYETPSPLRKSRSSSVESRRRITPEFALRKSITPTEVDVEIQEITMTDHRIERDKLRRGTPSPMSKSRIGRTYTKSSGDRARSDASFVCPVRRTRARQRTSILESSVFESKGDPASSDGGRRSGNRRSARDGEQRTSVISLSRLARSPETDETTASRRDVSRVEEVGESDIGMSRSRERRIESARGRAEEEIRFEGRASSRSSNRTWTGSRLEDRTTRGSRVTSADSSQMEKHFGGTPITTISRGSEKRGEKTRAESDRARRRSARLTQGALREKSSPPFADGGRNRGRADGSVVEGAATVGEIDEGIDARYRTIAEAAVSSWSKTNRKIVDYRESARAKSADRIGREDVSSLRKTTRTTSAKGSSSSRQAIPPTRDCGRRHGEAKRETPSRFSPSGRIAKVVRPADIAKTSPSRRVAPEEDRDRSSASKFFTYTVEARRRAGASIATERSTRSSERMNVKRKIVESEDGKMSCARKLSRALTGRDEECRKYVERVDSVESALRRFDSIGVESERSAPSFRTSPEISLQTMGVQQTRTSAAQEQLLVASKESMPDTSRVSTSTPRAPRVDVSPKIENIARKRDTRVVGRETYPSGRITKTGSAIGNRQISMQRLSPACKRRLFDSKREIRKEQAKSSYATRKRENRSYANLRSRGKEAARVRPSTVPDRAVAKRSTRMDERPTIPVKPLRSIEDIRRSIDSERSKPNATRGSRSSAIATRSADDGVDARRSISDAARSVLGGGDPAEILTKVKSCVSRIAKSPSPDTTARKRHETNARATRGSVPSSPSKSPDVAPRRASTESKSQEAKPSRRFAVAKGAESIASKTTVADVADGVVLQNGSLHESSTTKKSGAFVIDFDDRSSKENDAVPPKKVTPTKKSSSDKHQVALSASSRSTASSASPNSSASPGQASSTKNKMATKSRTPVFSGSQTPDNLVDCRMCGRRFAQDRISLHEQICAKTMNKKRKQFDAMTFRVKGTELEPFVKKGFSKKQEKAKKPEPKSDWRRKHEDFLLAIRSAKQVQAHLAAGGKLSDLPPPPPSDTSDYIQCPHCGRKFNQAAAERHIPKCEHMLHNKPAHARAPRARR